MIYKQNLHTHSTYCDGKDTPESTVLRAIELGFDTIGFSSHSPMGRYTLSMEKEKVKDYQAEIYSLKEKYKDKIKVYCGLEEELYSDAYSEGYEYVIGSVHYIKKDGNLICIDVSNPEKMEQCKDMFFGGNYLEIAKLYYETMCKLHTELRYKMNFVAHFDIVAKFFERLDFIDQDNKRYRGYALDALKFLSDKGYPFEVNTGGMSRGYRTIPYPAPFLLKELNKMGGRVLISSDCHDNTKLNLAFDKSLEIIKEAGFKEVQIFNGKDFEPVPII